MKCLLQGLFLFIVVCTGWNTVNAQKTEFIHLQATKVKILSSAFSKAEVLDSRRDTAHVGLIQRGAFNRNVFLDLEQPMKNEIATTVARLIDSARKEDGTLLINIRKFYISENTAFATESGMFNFRAGFYVKQDTLYKHMFSLDTTVKMTLGMDVTKRLLELVPEVLGTFIKQAVYFDQEKCDAKLYTLHDIQHIEDLEKKEIPVYSVDVLKKGLYATYEDFKNNRPSNENVIIEHKKGFSRPLIYEMTDKGKKGKEILRKYYYVVSDGEKMYISRAHALYELTKTNGNFYFTGVGKDGADMGTALLASAAFGLLTAGMAANHDTAIFEFMLDHVSGKFVPVKKIKD
jgi:hypothetical protein